ncbi:MAG: hypothetical protein ACYDD1_18455, partial [Caulobacteraceae bacterium]
MKSVPVNVASKPGVLVYRRAFLPISETFIVDHIETLQRWRPVPICDNTVPGGLSVAPLVPTRIYADGDGRAAHWATQFGGVNSTLRTLVGEQKVALIHAHFLLDGVRIARFARHHRLPLIITAHGYDATTWP